MSAAIRGILIALLAVTGMMMNHSIQTKAHSLHFLKEDLEIAVHDAALETDIEATRQGKVVFNEVLAEETLKKSFEANSRLSSSEYILKELVFFDSNDTYPITFQSSVSGFSDVFFSPTILAIIETKKDSYFGNQSSETFMQPASYSYHIKENTVPNITNVLVGSPSEQGFLWTVPYTRNVTSTFGMRTNPVTGEYKLHAGMDIATPGVENTVVVSAKDGTVIFSGFITGYGNIVVVSHGNGLETRYAHLSSTSVSTGDSIVGGQTIGRVGSTGNSTGPHMHLEIRINGKPYDPMQFY